MEANKDTFIFGLLSNKDVSFLHKVPDKCLDRKGDFKDKTNNFNHVQSRLEALCLGPPAPSVFKNPLRSYNTTAIVPMRFLEPPFHQTIQFHRNSTTSTILSLHRLHPIKHLLLAYLCQYFVSHTRKLKHGAENGK